ncbi:hypothetical protein CRG98_009030 [Punica granatum]|uniref:indole-3-pyruvate monooxygenase n=1 Tax=Punica granatum TaxID=22663 RepID=A0A2I0KPV5_PUNGR|nr:hypothetical protein CRG98_009030 [Punica granatum]
MEDQLVIVVGAGPAGLSAAASLSHLSIPYMVLEREDCFASIWTKYAYDRLHLHLKKQYCELPHMPFPADYPDYVPKAQFVQYLDDYVARFRINPVYQRSVESAVYDETARKWRLVARDLGSGGAEEYYACRFLVVASGETANPFIPQVEGLSTFLGKVLHSTRFKSGEEFKDKSVLVVGSGNSGMEIALDLANHGAMTSIAARSPVHILTKEMVSVAFFLTKYIPPDIVDSILVLLSKLVYGDMLKYGIRRPTEGPFSMKLKYGKYPIIDVGTCKKIRSGEIQVLPAIKSIDGNIVRLEDGKSHPFDSIVFCTGFNRSTNKWLKGDDLLLGEDGICKQSFPNHWKGKNGLYCVGLSRRGLYGAAADALNVANDIKQLLQ